MAFWSLVAIRAIATISVETMSGGGKSATLKRFLEYLGIEEGRVQFSWVSAAEGIKFSQVIDEVTRDIKKLGPQKQFVEEKDSEGVRRSQGVE